MIIDKHSGPHAKAHRKTVISPTRSAIAISSQIETHATWWHDMSHERVFKTRYFTRWMRKTELLDDMLCSAITQMTVGLIDADLGHNVIKKLSPEEICHDH